MGHALDKTQEAYARFDPIKQAPLYEKYATFLTIEKIDVVNSPEFKNQLEEIERLKKENQMFALERSELQAMKTKLEDTQNENKEREDKFDKKVKQEVEEMKELFMKLLKVGGDMSPLIEKQILTKERLNKALKK
jgi:biopolymer transport protein ExbB/TolQ